MSVPYAKLPHQSNVGLCLVFYNPHKNSYTIDPNPNRWWLSERTAQRYPEYKISYVYSTYRKLSVLQGNIGWVLK